MIHNSVNILRAFKMVKIRYFKFKFMRMLAYVRKLTVLSLFCAYLIIMAKIYLYYKNMIPSFDSSVLRERPYLIDTEGYKLPDFDPFDLSIRGYIPDPPELDCSEGKRPLTSSSSSYFDPNSETPEPTTVLFLHEEYASDYGVDYISCCYRAVKRNASGDPRYSINDSEYNYPDARYYVENDCRKISEKVTTVSTSAVVVQCSYESSIIYKNSHFFINFKELIDREKLIAKKSRKVEGYMNVMILGLDSTSRLNMQRYLPKTFRTLKEIDAVDLMGFNKNYENTYPNLIAILTGLYEHDSEFRNYLRSVGGYYDTAPFMWKNFSTAGYNTVYGEDCSTFGTFAYKKKKGFEYPPTDFYLRPYFQASEDLLGWKGGIAWISGCEICSGSKLNLQHIIDYAEETSKRFYFSERRYFSLLWSSSLTHDRINFAGVADDPLATIVKNIGKDQYWNNTVVFFISDHGARFGRIRETYIGSKEESLPYVFVIFPKWFKEKYSTAYTNFLHNRLKLTTTQDLHETLKDILLRNYENESYVKKNHIITSSQFRFSLFKKIPGNRTCIDAKIPFQYCAGVVATEVPISPKIELAAKVILNAVNRGLTNFTNCHQLSISNINRSYLVDFYEDNLNYTIYEIQITTYPGQAVLEGLVKFSKSNLKRLELIGNVNRINSYRGQSDCITDSTFVKYCFCK